jgi:tRNA pseudouridine38-40 synthase
MHYRAVVAYDGTHYSGFQRQLEQPTIQEALEQSIASLAGQPVTISGAGRTDSGVHALGQVIAFKVDWKHSPLALQRALNVNLPPDISLQKTDAVSDDFHPRFDARRRLYRYRIHNAPVRDPLRRLYCWHVGHVLEVELMNEAAECLIGKRDFSTFGRPTQGASTIREVFKAHWYRENVTLNFEIEANAFLYKMVRSLVGTMKLVGEGKWGVKDFSRALDSCNRQRAGKTAPPQGLCLMSVSY